MVPHVVILLDGIQALPEKATVMQLAIRGVSLGVDSFDSHV